MTYRIRDALSGALVFLATTDARLGASSSWNRGAMWLVKNRLLAN